MLKVMLVLLSYTFFVSALWYFIYNTLIWCKANVHSVSMNPTLFHGEVLKCRVYNFLCPRVDIGDIVMFIDPEDMNHKHILIKRINKIRFRYKDRELWVLGDNMNESRDSRKFGWIRESDIIAVAHYKYMRGNKR